MSSERVPALSPFPDTSTRATSSLSAVFERLVTTKSPELEARETLIARVKEASAYVSMDRLCLSPQCGFSGNVGNTVMTAEEQMAKLRLVVDSAQALWG